MCVCVCVCVQHIYSKMFLNWELALNKSVLGKNLYIHLLLMSH